MIIIIMRRRKRREKVGRSQTWTTVRNLINLAFPMKIKGGKNKQEEKNNKYNYKYKGEEENNKYKYELIN